MLKKTVFFSIALGLLLLISCKKDSKVTVSWAFFDFPYDFDLTSVKMQTTKNWHIVGGEAWASGIYANIQHDTLYTLDSIAPKRLNAITLDNNNNLATVGYTGILLTKHANMPSQWNSNKLFNSFDVLRDIDCLDDSTGLAVAGVAYHNGYLFRLGKNNSVTRIDTFSQSLRSIAYISKSNAVVVGYGTILHMLPDGQWVRLRDFGDFYLDVDFPSDQIGYIVGNAGSILKTTDGGNHWTYLQKKNTYSRKTAFRAVHFMDDQNGFITGEHGLLWKTTNGGENWTIGQSLPDIEFHDIDVLNDVGILVGKSGTIVTFNPDF